jgi:DNA-binding response OmpR family regulator
MCHGEALPDSFFAGLEREVIEAMPIRSIGRGNRIDVDVLLLWLSPGTAARVMQDTRSWIEMREAKVGLIGCAPNGDIEDTIVAFEAGVDDFVAGRCSVRELASRIHALRQRLYQSPTPSNRATRGLRLDAVSHEVQRGDRTIRLSTTEAAVLKVLISAGGRTLSRESILDLAWGEQHFEIGERAVDNVILRLRRKLGQPQLIDTVRGVGFRLASE